jgi:hypothetical protein
MARYSSHVISPAALANDTGFAWLMGVAAAGGKLRRVILGCRNTTVATAVTDFQAKVGIGRVSTDGTGALTAATVNKLDPRHPAASLRSGTAWATSPPTVGAAATDILAITFNTKSGVDLPAEFLEEFWIDNLVTDGFAFLNRGGLMPAAHVFDMLYEWEE